MTVKDRDRYILNACTSLPAGMRGDCIDQKEELYEKTTRQARSCSLPDLAGLFLAIFEQRALFSKAVEDLEKYGVFTEDEAESIEQHADDYDIFLLSTAKKLLEEECSCKFHTPSRELDERGKFKE